MNKEAIGKNLATSEKFSDLINLNFFPNEKVTKFLLNHFRLVISEFTVSVINILNLNRMRESIDRESTVMYV